MGATILLGRARRVLGVTAVTAFSALVLAGCAADSSTNPAHGHDERLILEDGYAWVRQIENGIFGITQAGYIFNRNNTGFEVMFRSIWQFSEMEWSVDGNKLSIPSGEHIECVNGDCITTVIVSEYEYSFSDDKLILVDIDDEDTLELVKAWVGDDIFGEVELDPALVNTVWKHEYPETGETAGWWFLYNKDQKVRQAVYTLVDENDEAIDFVMYHWSTSGEELNLIAFLGDDASVTYPYSVSGDELTVNGVTYTLEDSVMFKKLSQKLPDVKLSKRLGLLR